jgi:hypothetical protein
VLARFAVMANSLDEIIMAVVARKSAILGQLLNDLDEESFDAA